MSLGFVSAIFGGRAKSSTTSALGSIRRSVQQALSTEPGDHLYDAGLTSFVRELRRHNREDLDAWVESQLRELKTVLGGTQPPIVRSRVAVSLLYLHQLGYRMDWAVFPILQLLPVTTPRVRARAHLAATYFFHEASPATESVLLMSTNHFKSSLRPGRGHMAHTDALTVLATVANPALALALTEPVLDLLNPTQEGISVPTRKRAAVTLYRFLLAAPGHTSWVGRFLAHMFQLLQTTSSQPGSGDRAGGAAGDALRAAHGPERPQPPDLHQPPGRAPAHPPAPPVHTVPRLDDDQAGQAVHAPGGPGRARRARSTGRSRGHHHRRPQGRRRRRRRWRRWRRREWRRRRRR